LIKPKRKGPKPSKAEMRRPATRLTTRTIAPINMDEDQVDFEEDEAAFKVINKRIKHIYNTLLSKMKVGTQEKTMLMYKVPKTVFAYGPDALVRGTSEVELLSFLDAFFRLVIDFKQMRAELKAKARRLTDCSIYRVRAIVEELLKVYKLVAKFKGKLFMEWKRQFLSYVFMGCLPAGVKKAKFYIGALINVHLLGQLKEKDLMFTCYASTGKNIIKKGQDCSTNQRRKRTLKMQTKKRDITSIRDDALKAGMIHKYLAEGAHLKKQVKGALD
jgi:hypothetical protein